MTTTDKDLGWSKLLEQIRLADDATVDTGLFEGETHPGAEMTLPQIGAVHEFGVVMRHGRSGGATVIIPERSWLRSTVDEQGDKLKRVYDRQLDRVAQGKTTMGAAMLAFGEMAASAVRRKITTGPFTPKAPATLASEGPGFTRPLVWLGYMRAAVRSRITMGSRHEMTPKGTR